MSNPLADLQPALLAKLASIAVHSAELRSPSGDKLFDGAALDTALHDPHVVGWLRDMQAIAMAPRTRDGIYP